MLAQQTSHVRIFRAIHCQGSYLQVAEDYVAVGYWSTIEVPVAVICACMPAIRSLLGRMFPTVFGTTRKTGSGYKNYSDQSTGRFRSLGSTPGRGPQNKPKTEWPAQWAVASHNFQDNSSELELVRTPTMRAEEAFQSRPGSQPADMPAATVRGSEGRDRGWPRNPN